MMLPVWILLVIVSISILAFSLTTTDDEMSLVTSSGSALLWLVVAYGAMNLEVFSESSGDFTTQPEPALAIIALIGTLLSLINVCVIVFDWFGSTSDGVNGT